MRYVWVVAVRLQDSTGYKSMEVDQLQDHQPLLQVELSVLQLLLALVLPSYGNAVVQVEHGLRVLVGDVRVDKLQNCMLGPHVIPSLIEDI